MRLNIGLLILASCWVNQASGFWRGLGYDFNLPVIGSGPAHRAVQLVKVKHTLQRRADLIACDRPTNDVIQEESRIKMPGTVAAGVLMVVAQLILISPRSSFGSSVSRNSVRVRDWARLASAWCDTNHFPD